MTEIATPEPMPTPLLDRHEALGAKIVEFAGWLMPISYAGILEEHRAVRSAAGLFDLSHMGELVVEGPEAGVALAAALVTDPPSLAVGRAHYSMICAPDGGILDDLIVYRLAPERFMVVANASNSRTVSDALAERLDGFGAVLDDRSLATGLVAIQGPRSLEILQPLAGVDLASIRYYGIAEGVVAGIPAQVARTGYTGEDGFELFVDVERAGEAWDAVLDAGRPLGLVPVGLGARDTLRLEAGMPLYGNELDRATTPVRGGPGPGRQAGQGRRLHGSRRPREGRRRRRPAPPCRARAAGPRDRPPRLPGPRCRRGHGRRHLGDDVAHARAWRSPWRTSHRRMPNPVRCSTSRSAVHASRPRWCHSRSTSGPPDVRRAPGPATQDRSANRARPGDAGQAPPRRYRPNGPRRPALHQGARVGPRRRRRGRRRHHPVRGRPAGRHRVRRAARGRQGPRPARDLRRRGVGQGRERPVRPGRAARSPAANDALAGSPELVNSDPYGEGWMLRISLADPAQVEELLDAAAYEQLVTEA